MWDEEDWYNFQDEDVDKEEEEKLNTFLNTEEYPKKSHDPTLIKLSVFTKEYCGTKKPQKMTKVYVAPHLKEDHSFVSEQEWVTFMRSLEANKLYKLSDLVKHFNQTIRPYKQLTNKGFAHIKFVKSSFKIKYCHEKDGGKNKLITYYMKK